MILKEYKNFTIYNPIPPTPPQINANYLGSKSMKLAFFNLLFQILVILNLVKTGPHSSFSEDLNAQQGMTVANP